MRNEIVPRFRHFHEAPYVKRIICLLMAHFATHPTDGQLVVRRAYRYLDKFASGEVSYEVLQEALEEAGIEAEDLHDLHTSVNMSKTGYIFFSEFLAAMLPDELRHDRTIC